MNTPTLRILLVGDSKEDFQTTRNLLAENQTVATELLWRDTLASGLQALQEESVDVILADLKLGSDSGLDMIRHATDQLIRTPFIMLTEHSDTKLDAQALTLGAADFLIKGQFDGHTLLRSIRHALDREIANERLAASETHYRHLFENNPTPMCLVEPESGSIRSMNQAAVELYGLTASKMGEIRLDDLRHGACDSSIPQEGLPLRKGGVLEVHQAVSGQELHVEVLSQDVEFDQVPLRLMILTDMTRQIDDNRRLRLLRRCMESSSNGFTISDVRETDQPIIYTNSTFEQITGYPREEVEGRNCRFLQGGVQDPDNEPALIEIRRAIQHKTEVSVVLRNYKKDGTPFWNNLYLAPVRDSDERVTHYVGVQNDISERKSIEHQLAYNTSHDVLTQLPNRALLEDRLNQGAQWAMRYGKTFGLLYIGLDGFKLINDSEGHRGGDRVLVEVADRLSKHMRAGDTVARISGDEFALLLPDLADRKDALFVAEKVQSCLSAAYNLNGDRLHLTASIGVATSDGAWQKPRDLIHQAGMAMRHAKQLGRNNVQWFSEALNTRASYRVKLRSELQTALENDRLSVFYHPVLSAHTEKAASVEALVRWQHPEHGLISPADFVPLAEETGLIVELGEAVLRQACRDMVELQATGFRECSVAVNVSPIQLRKDGFPETVRAALKDSGLRPDNLELEIVETAVLHDASEVLASLYELRELGVRVAIDDFGTGFSSLSHIKLLPANKIKIDQSFIKDVIQNRSDAAITQGVISMAHHLSLEVVAEGVETDAHAAFLRRHRCDLLQGYAFAKPMPFDQLLQFMNDNRSQVRHSEGSQDGTQQSILLLDDESNILRALTRVLRRDGYQIYSTTSVRKAFSLLAANKIQVIISDQRMPEMSGTEFFAKVKDIHPNTVRIVLSGYTDLKSVTEAINEGAIYKFLTKPWDDKQLREHVQQAFQFHSTLTS